MNYLKLNGDLMMKKLFYMVITYLLFASELSYASSKKIPDFSGEWAGIMKDVSLIPLVGLNLNRRVGWYQVNGQHQQ